MACMWNFGNTVEGLVHITALKDDYYTFDQETHELRGELTKKYIIWDRKSASVWQMRMR